MLSRSPGASTTATTATPTPDSTATPTPSPTAAPTLAAGAGGVSSSGRPAPSTTTPPPRSSSTNAMNAGGSFVFDAPSLTTAVIAGGVLVSSCLVIVPGANALRIYLNKAKQQAEVDSKLLDRDKDSMEEDDAEEVRIEIPEPHDESVSL